MAPVKKNTTMTGVKSKPYTKKEVVKEDTTDEQDLQVDNNTSELGYGKYTSPIGDIEYYANNNKLVKIIIDNHGNEGKKSNDDGNSNRTTPIIQSFEKELKEYFEGKKKTFDTPIDYTMGTEFQQSVWKELCKVDYSQTVSYKQIAINLGRPNCSRAVASACRTNKFPLIVPCHRIVSSSGKVLGYMGKQGVDKQHWLYNHEVKYSKSK